MIYSIAHCNEKCQGRVPTGDRQQGRDQTVLSQHGGRVVPHSSPARLTVGKGSTGTPKPQGMVSW